MDRESLLKTQLFAGVQPEELDGLLACLRAVSRDVERGETVFAAGEMVRQIGLVLSGRVQVESIDMFGNRTILSDIGPGDVFAEAYALVPHEPLPYSVTAVTKGEVLLLQADNVMGACRAACPYHTRILTNMLAEASRKNRQLSQHIHHTAPRTIRGRLLTYLSYEAHRQGTNSFAIPFNRQQLADYLGADRSALSAELGRMKREGLIDFTRNRFTVTGEQE